jgi:hypothetical protein
MTTTVPNFSITGRPTVHVAFREVWADQIDHHGENCEWCQLEGQQIECNVYVPVRGAGNDLLHTCRCCATTVVFDHVQLDPSRDAIIEYAKER